MPTSKRWGRLTQEQKNELTRRRTERATKKENRKKHFSLQAKVLGGKAPANSRQIAAEIKLASCQKTVKRLEQILHPTPEQKKELRFARLDVEYERLGMKRYEDRFGVTRQQEREEQLLHSILMLKFLGKNPPADTISRESWQQLKEFVRENRRVYTVGYGLTDADVNELVE